MKRFPKYPKQAHGTGQARIKIAGKSVYLGKHNSPESYKAYSDELRRWEARGGVPDTPVGTVAELIARFMTYADKHYRKPDGKPKTELAAFKTALTPLDRLFGRLSVTEFRPRDLRAYREATAAGSWLTAAEKEERTNLSGRSRYWRWSRRHINRNVVRVRTVFRWAEAEELVPAGTFAKLQAVRGLEHGAAGVRDNHAVEPVPEEDLAKTLDVLPPGIRALVRVQLWTGARPAELLALDPAKFEKAGAVWTYRPAEQKTAHLGHTRVLLFGPRAREALATRLGGAPLWPVLTVNGYNQAIRRACKVAGVPRWNVYRLRHNAATRLVEQFGWDVARIVLGHRSVNTTRIYADDALAKAMAAIRKAG